MAGSYQNVVNVMTHYKYYPPFCLTLKVELVGLTMRLININNIVTKIISILEYKTQGLNNKC